MKRLLVVLYIGARIVSAPTAQSANTGTGVYEFIGGEWFDGQKFVSRHFYSVQGVLTTIRPRHIDCTIALTDRFVIPPFGEAHNHNVETLNKVDVLIARYLQHGIFYVKN